MKKKTSRIFALALTMIMILSMAVFMTSCGGAKTLQEYTEGDKEFREQIETAMDSFKNAGMEVNTEIKDNTIIYSFKYDQNFSKDEQELMKTSFETLNDTFESACGDIAKKFEEDTKIEGIKCQIICLDGDGTELYNKTFEAK